MFGQTHLRAALVLSLIAAVPGLHAQDSVAVNPQPAWLAFDDIVLLPSIEATREAIGRAATDARIADETSAARRVERTRTKSRLEIAKSELETVKRRLELAKKEKDEARQAELQAERASLESRIRLLERWLDVHEAAVRASEAQQAAAEAQRKLAEAEVALIEKRDQSRARAEVDSTARTALLDDMRRSARRLLELRRDDAERRRQLADRERDVAQQQLDLLEAQFRVR